MFGSEAKIAAVRGGNVKRDALGALLGGGRDFGMLLQPLDNCSRMLRERLDAAITSHQDRRLTFPTIGCMVIL